MNKFWEIASEIVTGIIGLAVVAVLIVNGTKTSSVINASTGGFANMVGTAESG